MEFKIEINQAGIDKILIDGPYDEEQYQIVMPGLRKIERQLKELAEYRQAKRTIEQAADGMQVSPNQLQVAELVIKTYESKEPTIEVTQEDLEAYAEKRNAFDKDRLEKMVISAMAGAIRSSESVIGNGGENPFTMTPLVDLSKILKKEPQMYDNETNSIPLEIDSKVVNALFVIFSRALSFENERYGDFTKEENKFRAAVARFVHDQVLSSK